MKEIKFRGRHVVNGTWQYGFLLAPHIIGEVKEINNNDGRGYHPEVATFCLVDTETVGRPTGLKDKNGVEIWEGDLYTTTFEERVNKELGYNLMKKKKIQEVKWGRAGFGPLENEEFITIIGNIYENPEQLT